MDGAAVLREAIIDGLRSGEWQPGHRMPTERQLSEQYAIGRSTVRRVLLQLKAQRLITQTVGSGTYVGEDAAALLGQAAAPDRTLQTSPSELMDARLALEPSILGLVVRNATAPDLDEMRRCCDAAERAATLEEFERWDRALHEAIADAAHNGVVTALFQAMGRARSQDEWGLLKRRSLTPERRLEYQVEHRRLVEALVDRDVSRAADQCEKHLLHVRKNLLGY